METMEKLFGASLEQGEAMPEPQVEAPAEAALQQGEQPAADAPDAAPEPVVAPEPAKPEPGFIPIAAMLDEREKRQRLERENEELRKAQAERQAKAQPQIDPIIDPEGYQAHVARQVEIGRQRMSAAMAVDKYGEETVKAAESAFNAALARNPALGQEIADSVHPYDFAVKWHRKQQLASEIGDVDSVEALVRREAAKYGYVLNPAAPGSPGPAALQPAAPGQQPPPRSLASAPAAGAPNSGAYQPSPVMKRLFG